MLSGIQRRILDVLSPLRSESSHVAGSTPMNVDSPRLSADIDIFNDNPEILESSFKRDIAALQKSGFVCRIERTPSKNSIGEAVVSSDSGTTVVQWIQDSAWRFFPAVRDDIFGYRLDPRDLAVNKVLALAGRDAVRDYHDICQMLKRGLNLGAHVLAACGKDEGYTPDSLLSALSFAPRKWRRDEFDAIRTEGERLDFVDCRTMLNEATRKAMDELRNIPAEHVGCMLLDMDGKPFLPRNGEGHVVHRISCRGSFPVFPQNFELNP